MDHAFGRALNMLRTARGLTQEDFSIVSSRTYISTLERGMKSPTLEKVGDISTLLKIHPLTLLVLAYSQANVKQAANLLGRVQRELAETLKRHEEEIEIGASLRLSHTRTGALNRKRQAR